MHSQDGFRSACWQFVISRNTTTLDLQYFVIIGSQEMIQPWISRSIKYFEIIGKCPQPAMFDIGPRRMSRSCREDLKTKSIGRQYYIDKNRKNNWGPLREHVQNYMDCVDFGFVIVCGQVIVVGHSSS